MIVKFQISPENHPIQVDQVVTIADLAEEVTTENLPDFLNKLAEKSHNKDYLNSILEIVAEKLDMNPDTLLGMFRDRQKNCSNINDRLRLRFLSVDELYSMSGPTDWVVKPYLDKGSLAMLFGKSGTLKSFIAIDIGLSVATGSDWHGNPVTRGAVFYICGEGQNGISRRIRAWELHHGLNVGNEPFFVSDRPAQFLNEESAGDVSMAVNQLCNQHGKPSLIIIDTLNRNFGSGDENNTADMTRFVEIVDANLRRFFDCTVLIVHHTGKNEKSGARGSYSLYAALDWVYKATKRDMTLQLTNEKTKDFDQNPPFCLHAEIISLDWNEENGEPLTSLILSSTTDTFDTVKNNKPLSGANKIAFDSLLKCLRESGEKSVHVDKWRKVVYEAGISKSDKTDTKQKAFNRAKEFLLSEGLIENKDDLWKPTQDK